MAQIVTAQFVGQTSCGFVREKYYEIEISAGRSGCLCVRDVQGARLLPVFHAGRPAEKLEDHRQRKNARR
jgi:hypothetical protein